jgi:hypothetical protein
MSHHGYKHLEDLNSSYILFWYEVLKLENAHIFLFYFTTLNKLNV